MGFEKKPISDNFVVDIERFSHVSEEESSSDSRISSEVIFNDMMEKNHSRKGSIRGGGGCEKKINPAAANGTPALVEESTTVAMDHPKIHHQITIKKGSLSPSPESKHGVKRSKFRHSGLPWSTDPRKVMVFFASICFRSSMGTILLIYFTLSMTKLHDDDLH